MAGQESILCGGLPTAADSHMLEIFDLFPIPTIVVSPALCIQKVSQGLLAAWGSEWAGVIGADLFGSLYQGSATERFDRIVLSHAIEVAITTRSMRQCHAAYSKDGSFWTARVIPTFRGSALLFLIVEWEQAEVSQAKIYDNDPHYAWPWHTIDEAFRIFAQSVKDYALFLLDTRGYITTWNVGAEKIKGYRAEEIVGKHFSGFYGQDDLRAGKPERELEVCLRDGRVEDEGWRYRKDGSRFWANVVITAIYKSGTHVGFGKVTRDLTERKNAEIQLINAFQESSKLKTEFLANMSHEIRTPMHGMLSASNLLLDTPLTEEQRDTVNIIEESGAILLQIINNILDYSKIASGTVSVNTDSIDLAAIVKATIRSVQPTLQQGVHIDSTLEPNLPKSATGDPLRYRQILQNIMDNAAKFTEKGSIIVYAALKEEDDATYTVLTELQDTGIGVPESMIHNLFKPFTQLDSSTRKRFQGTGLGLCIAKSLAKLLGGQIGYRPGSNGEGSVFWFTVKLQKLAIVDNDASILASHRKVGSDINLQKSLGEADVDDVLLRLKKVAPTKRILAAEDNAINQTVLMKTLQPLGFQKITMTSNGEEALSELLSSPQMYDLILMDISMPVMDGHRTTGHIRNRGLHIPIIAMTAYALKGDMELCIQSGMDDYIAKPAKKMALLRILLKWLT